MNKRNLIIGLVIVACLTILYAAFAPGAHAAEPVTLEGNRAYTERVHTYAHGNSQGIQHLARRDSAQQVQIDHSQVEILNLQADQLRQDKVMGDMQSQMGSMMSQTDSRLSNLERDMDKAHEGNAIALAVAGHQFDTKGDFQTAISGSTIHGKHAIAVGVGGAITDRVFLNAGMSRSGSTTGGVMSTTISW